VNEDHEKIEELLAGYVLRSLSGEDALEADRLLSRHVPTCITCRGLLADFQSITADLALTAAPMRPPDTLLPHLHRELQPRRRRGGRPMQLFAVAASVVMVASLAGLAITQGVRANHGEARAATIGNIMDFVARPDATVGPPVGPTTEISEPGRELFYLYGRDVPMPPKGMVYRVWLVSGSTPTYVGEFLPDEGFVGLEVRFDPTRYDTLWVSVSPSGSQPMLPTEKDVLWRAGG
jgi:Anti-sigma-K factor rskA